MHFNHILDSLEKDYSREFEIEDIKVKFAGMTHIFNFTVKNIDLKVNHFKGIEMVCRLNSILKTLTNKVLGCRLQKRLPYLLEREETGSRFFDQLRDYTHIEFDNLPDKCHPVLKKDLSKTDIDEIIKTQGQAYSTNKIIEVLGCYSARTGFKSSEEDEPSVTIDINKIDNLGNKYTPDHIAVIVLVHELCHALLDPNNYYRYTEEGTKFIAPKIKYESAYGCLKEEAVANAMAYKFIQKLGNKTLLSEAESFMSSQPDAYLYGYLMANDPEWDEETVREEWIREKIAGNEDAAKREWLEGMITSIKNHRNNQQ